MTKIYNKLVRDNIPAIIAAIGKFPVFHYLSEEEYKEALKAKLLEEVNEFIHAKSRNEMTEEMADISSALLALMEIYRIEPRAVIEARRLKDNKNGRFRKRIFLEHVEVK